MLPNCFLLYYSFLYDTIEIPLVRTNKGVFGFIRIQFVAVAVIHIIRYECEQKVLTLYFLFCHTSTYFMCSVSVLLQVCTFLSSILMWSVAPLHVNDRHFLKGLVHLKHEKEMGSKLQAGKKAGKQRMEKHNMTWNIRYGLYVYSNFSHSFSPIRWGFD